MGASTCECGFEARWSVDPRGRWRREHAVHHAHWSRGVPVRIRDVERAFEKAALIYKREVGIDTTPAPWGGPKKLRVLNGNLVAFALVIPLPDGRQLLEHLWTCADARRSGLATETVTELVAELGGPLVVYDVVSESGERWVESAERSGLIRCLAV